MLRDSRGNSVMTIEATGATIFGALMLVVVAVKVFKEHDLSYRDGALLCAAIAAVVLGLIVPAPSARSPWTIMSIVGIVAIFSIVSRHTAGKISRGLRQTDRIKRWQRDRSTPNSTGKNN